MTRRSRSSFDLRDALVTAEALSPKPPAAEPVAAFEGVPLIAFGAEAASAGAPPAAVAVAQPPRVAKRTLPDAPDTTAVASLVPKLSLLLEWVRGSQDVSRALVVDDEGLPLVGTGVGDLGETESLFAATGSVASAMKKLALASPGTLSPDFEGHVGDGPVLQLIGFSAARRAYVVAVSRREPFGAKDVELIRATFAAALATSVLGGAVLGPGAARASRAPDRGDP